MYQPIQHIASEVHRTPATTATPSVDRLIASLVTLLPGVILVLGLVVLILT